MKKTLSVILALMLILSALPMGLFGITASAATNGYYTYTVSNGKAKITDVDTAISGDITVPSTLGGYPVTSIGNSAFYNCTSITSITIPNTVTSIQYAAFSNCTKLENITIGKNVLSIDSAILEGCFAVTQIIVSKDNTVYHSDNNCIIKTESNTLVVGCCTSIIPNYVQKIDGYAFYGCSKLTNITIPDSVTSIGYYAFYNCTSLTSIIIPDSVTSIGEYAFYNCTSLTSIKLHNGITNMGRSVFEKTGYYNDIANWEEDVLYIANHLIEAKVTLTGNYTIKDGTKYIDVYAFSGCAGLVNITIPESVTMIGRYAFDSCYDLKKVYYGGSYNSGKENLSIGSNNNYLTDATWVYANTEDCLKYSYDNEKMTASITDCYELAQNVVIPKTLNKNGKIYTVTSIGGDAFYDCTKLTSVSLPDSVTSIGGYAFYNCKSLTSITIPDGVTSIGRYAFYGCTSLTSITIPDSVTSIGDSAFRGCTSLTSMTLPFVGSSRDASGTNDAVFGYIFGYTSSSDGSATRQYFSSSSSYYYYIPSSIKSVTITDDPTIPYGAFYNCAALTSVSLPDSVTSIGERAFYNCTALTSVSLPDSVTSIGEDAFYWCLSLKSVYITDIAAWCKINFYSSESNPLFYNGKLYLNGTPVTNLMIPNDVTQINSYAFYNCDTLTSVTIPDTLRNINAYAFSGCTGIKTVQYNGSYRTKMKNLTIAAENDSLNSAVWQYSTGYGLSYTYDEVNLTATVDAYSGSATSVYVPSTVQKGGKAYAVTGVGEYSFYDCTALVNITLPETVTDIGEYAFYGCSNLKSINFSNNLKLVGYGAFIGCAALETVNYSGSYRTRCEDVTINGDNDPLISAVWNYAIGEHFVYKYDDITKTATIIDFSGCGTSIVIPATVTNKGITYKVAEIGDYVFANCINITDIIIPSGVVTIENYAFKNCISLKSVVVPNSVTSIGRGAFTGCNNLEEITLPFIGSSRNTGSSEQSVFGYIFDYTTSDASGTTYQKYANYYPYGNYYYIPSSIKSVTITDDPTIPYGAFYNCTSLTSVSLPDSVTSIGSYAFYECTSLTNITIPDSVTSIGDYVFSGCRSLESAVIGKNVQNLSDYLFENCISLKTVTIGNKVLSISGTTFDNCVALETVNFNAANCTSMGSSSDPVFLGCINLKKINIGSNVTNIPDYAFNGCIELTDLVIPDGVTYIGAYAFEGCSSLKTLTIGCGVTKIGDCAFKGCTALETIDFNAVNCSTMGSSDYWDAYDYSVFLGCGKVKTLTIGDNVTNIPDYAFSGCTGLKIVTIGKSVANIEEYAFRYCTAIDTINFNAINCSEMAYVFDGLANLNNLNIGEGVSNIPYNAFYGCKGLTNLVIPDSVIKINSYAFNQCTSLRNVIIGKNVRCISEGAFYNCHALETITLPSGLLEIQRDAFEGCDNITDVFYMSEYYNVSIDYGNYDLEYAYWHYGSCIGKAKHVYSDNCDKICNDCGAERTPPHTYTNNCDAYCDHCGAERTPPHSYKSTVNTKATTSKNGKLTKTCSGCGKKVTQTIYYAKSFYLSSTSYTYNGRVQTPSVMVYDSAGNIISSKYYTVTYSSGRKSVGTYKVKITLKGMYSGSKTLSYKINPISVKKCIISVSATSYTYDGKTKTPSVYVYSPGGSLLKNGTHYTLSYSSGRKNVGTYKVTIKMKGGYSGSRSITYKINPPKTSISKITLSTTSLKVYVTKKSTQVTGYQIQYSPYSDFYSAATKTITSYKTTSASLTGLDSGTTYYVRVRTYKTVSGVKYYSGWSTVMVVTTKPAQIV